MAALSEQYRGGGKKASEPKPLTARGLCPKCGAVRIDAQLGLEKTPDEYVANLVAVFREVRRVLRDDGTVWLNLGDSYASYRDSKCSPQTLDGEQRSMPTAGASIRGSSAFKQSGVKHKDLVGIPWMVAFALRADGWYLRQDIIWSKPNPMPESVTDRCTKAHEYVFLLSKSARYYYDAEAIKERITDSSVLTDGTRNKRSVWPVTTKPCSFAHFATFPPGLITPCVLAGCPEGGVVLDPFAGSGTTGQVAKDMGRQAVLIELSAEYCEIAVKHRLKGQESLELTP